MRRALRTALAAVALAAAAGVAAEERSTTADAIALAVCVIDSDIRTAAIARQQRGASRDEALRAVHEKKMPDAVYRAQATRLVDEVYRLRPPSLRAHVAERLQQCAAGAARRVEPAAADGCYQLTRYASDFFAARTAGVPLADTVRAAAELAAAQGLSDAAARRLGDIAERVYRTEVAAPEFRAGLFFHCVQPPQRKPKG